MVLFLDSSDNGDATALIGVVPGERPHVCMVGCWERPEHVTDWLVPREEVKARVAWAFEHWRGPHRLGPARLARRGQAVGGHLVSRVVNSFHKCCSVRAWLSEEDPRRR